MVEYCWAEGLAVYLQTTLVGNPTFPNFGEDLQRLAARGLSGVKSLGALDSVRTPRTLGTVMEEKAAYILAGAFIYPFPPIRRKLTSSELRGCGR